MKKKLLKIFLVVFCFICRKFYLHFGGFWALDKDGAKVDNQQLVTLGKFQFDIFWLNFSALLNISWISVTFNKFQLFNGWLKFLAS